MKTTQVFTQFPWAGGVNTSLDEALIQPGQLTVGDNLIFDYQSTKKKREGIDEDWDDCVFSVTSRSSSGTTRTLSGTFTHTGIIVGDKISIEGSANASYNGDFLTVTVSNGTTLSYTAVGSLTEASTPETAATWANSVIAGVDYWVESSGSKTQHIIGVLDNGAVMRWTSGARSRITDGGTAWTLPLAGFPQASLEVFNNKVFIGVPGQNNRVKLWDGTNTANSLSDMVSYYSALVMVRRGSSGTTRTLEFSTVVPLVNGDQIYVNNVGNSAYNGVFTIASGGGTKVITYVGGSSLSDPGTAATSISAIDTATETFTSSAHGLVVGDVVRFPVLGSITGISLATDYYVLTAPTSSTFTISATRGGSAVDIGGTSAGSPTVQKVNTNDTAGQIGISAPLGSILRGHQGRLTMNDKSRLDRWHYCATGDHTYWNGQGDSGASDIGIGDGDPTGIAGISPTFKGDIFVGKKSRLYRISGYIPDHNIDQVSNGIGFLCHNGITGVDQDDLEFVSDRGVHSMLTTNAYGSFNSAFISNDIQRTFNEDWTASRRLYIQSAYLAEINSVLYAVSDEDAVFNSAIWAYNVPLKAWYRFAPNKTCEALISVQDADRRRVYLGGRNGRLAQTQTGEVFDTDSTGASAAIQFAAVTGLLLVDGRIDTIKDFKKISVIYKPQGNSTITVSAKIDNYSSQPLSFQETNGTDLLGSTFILGQSVLGAEVVLAPYTLPIDGRGRGIKLRITQSGINEVANIQGFLIEYESAETQQETRLGDSK